ncbi:hypothetical protein OROHE_007921 [Orobanche hederae]
MLLGDGTPRSKSCCGCYYGVIAANENDIWKILIEAIPKILNWISYFRDSELYFIVVALGDTVHVIGEFDALGKCDVNSEKFFLIVHPDILVSGFCKFQLPKAHHTGREVKAYRAFSCSIDGYLIASDISGCVISEFPIKKFLEEYARTVLQESLESFYASGADEKDIWKTLIEAIPRFMNWVSSFRDSERFPKSLGVDFKCDEGFKKIKISEVMDIEEMAWARKYGLKGMIDASVRVRSNTASAEANEIIIPLEFKTGKETSGHAS